MLGAMCILTSNSLCSVEIKLADGCCTLGSGSKELGMAAVGDRTGEQLIGEPAEGRAVVLLEAWSNL